MSRLSYYEGLEERDDGISAVIPDLTAPKENKVVAFDADYLVYHALFAKDIDGNPVEWTIDRIEELQGKLSEMFYKAINSVEKYWDIQALFTFIRGTDKSFRKQLSSAYKAKRPEKHVLTDVLYNWLEVAHQAIPSNGGIESDDNCNIIARKTEGNCIVISNDKDLRQSPCIIFDPVKNKWAKITPKEAKFHLYMQYVCGDSTDGVSGCKGLGIAYFNKNFHIDMTDEEYEAALITAYEKSCKGNKELALKEMELNKALLTLKTE